MKFILLYKWSITKHLLVNIGVGATTWMNFRNMLNERSHIKRTKTYCMIAIRQNLRKDKINQRKSRCRAKVI